MIAVVWNLFFGLLTGLNHAGSLGHLDPVAINLNIDQALLGSEVLGQGRSSRCGIAHRDTAGL